MTKLTLLTFLWCILFSFNARGTKMPSSQKPGTGLEKKIQRLSTTTITADRACLDKGDQQALEKLIEASRLLDAIYLRQVWKKNPELKAQLIKDTSPLGQQRLHFFNQNVGPWSRLDHGEAFLENVPKEKPKGAGFYPEDMTKEEFEKWVATLSEKDKKAATGFFTVIERNEKRGLTYKWYSDAYREYLEPAAKLLLEAANLTSNSSLKKYLKARAESFKTNDYYDSDVAWMDLEAPIEMTIGPYETYEDELLGYKAAFEAFVTIRDDKETANLAKYSTHLQDVEDHLPLDDKYKNKKLGASSPIRVVDQVFTAGDARRGVMTAAFNLPNDEKVVKEKGSKRVMLKNVQLAKFEKVLTPISLTVLDKKELKDVTFDSFFTHILLHELMHGLGPHNIMKNGKPTTVRGELKDLYSAVEEAKADITGLWAMQYLIDKKVVDPKLQSSMYTTFLTSAFRSVRFGINEAHGKGIAVQFNYLTDEGAFVYDKKTGKFTVDTKKVAPAVRKLTQEILTLQAEGSYEKAAQLLNKYGVVRPEMQKALDLLKDVPVDIEPVYPLAGELSPATS